MYPITGRSSTPSYPGWRFSTSHICRVDHIYLGWHFSTPGKLYLPLITPIYPGCHLSTSRIPLFLSVYRSESFTGAKVKGHESCLWSEGCESSMERKFLEHSLLRSEVPGVRKFHGTKVLGTFAPEERKFHRRKSSMERKFLYFSLPGSECSTEQKFSLWSFRSRERKCRRTKRPVTWKCTITLVRTCGRSSLV